jgi:hypothetical protein
MKFLVTITEPDHFDRWEAMPDTDRDAVFATFRKYAAAVADRGDVLSGAGLARPGEARTLSPGAADARTVTEGPFAESAEQVGGFYLVELPDMDAAVETARLLPVEYGIEVRPVVEG